MSNVYHLANKDTAKNEIGMQVLNHGHYDHTDEHSSDHTNVQIYGG